MKILLADDHVLFRDGIHYHLRKLAPQVEILDAGNFQEAMELACRNPDITIALLDLNMPDNRAEECIRMFRSFFPDAAVVIISGADHPNDIERVMNWGASGFISKAMPAHKMIEALKLVLDGCIYLPQHFLKRDASPNAPEAHETGNAGQYLTPRQIEVLQHLAAGFSNKEIGNIMGLTEGTIKVHLSAIFRTLGVRRRIDAVLQARHLKLIEETP